MKGKKIEVAEYVKGEYVFKKRGLGLKGKVTTLGVTLLARPYMVLAKDSVEDTFGNVHTAVLNAIDSAVVLVIIFAGASWMLGHRSRAIEILIGVACGYLIVSNAVNLRDFLRSI